MITGIVLVALSLSIYLTQIVIFNDSKTTAFYFFQDIAFVPVSVFVVSVVLDQILSRREKKEKLRKMNIVISAFFNEAGSTLIRAFSQYNLNFEQLQRILDLHGGTTCEDFDRLKKEVENFEFLVDSNVMDLEFLKKSLSVKKDYILEMFNNPNLLEHDGFTDMLWAVFHVWDELDSRESLHKLPKSDMEHLSGDITRAFKLIIIEWILYMKHLKTEYPYLFSLASRKNPFSEKNQVMVM